MFRGLSNFPSRVLFSCETQASRAAPGFACILVPQHFIRKHPSIMPAVSLTIDKALGLDATAVAKVAHDAVKNGIGKPDMCEPLPRLPPLSHALISLAHASP